MAISFTRAPRIKAGECATAAQWNQFAAALNDRLRSGFADPTWRVWWRAASLVRKICADSETAHSAADEWFRWWMHAEPEHAVECEAGENEVNPLLVWARGNESPFGLSSEELRMPEPAPPDAPLSIYWQAAAQQRGVLTPTGQGNAPAWEAAAAVERIDYRPYKAPYLKGWGGFVPSHRSGADAFDDDFDRWMAWLAWERRCVRAPAPGDAYAAAWSYEPVIYQFLPLREGLAPLEFYPTPLRNYTYDPQRGCYNFDVANDPNAAMFARNVSSVSYGVDRYILHHLDGSVTELLYSDYIEAAYSGPVRLEHTKTPLLQEVMQWYASRFGAPNPEISGCDGWDWESFFGSQYPLAPAYGTQSGGEVTAVYPRWHRSAPAQDDLLELVEGGSGTEYQVHNGYVPAGWYVQTSGLQSVLTLALERADTGETIATCRIAPPESEYLAYLTDPPEGARVRVRVTSQSQWQAGGYVSVELAELVRAKPSVQDAYVVIRGMTTQGSGVSDVDTIGDGYSAARSAWQTWQRAGCVVAAEGLPPQSALPITAHPLHETLRRMFRRNLRMIDRVWITEPMLLSYEVGSDGKSVLRFRRYGFISGTRYDLWAGIAPDDEPPTKISPGIEYEVIGTNGYVVYAGTQYAPGQTFTGVDDESDWTSTGDAWPRQRDGIIRTAPKEGETNEWVVFLAQHRAKDTGWCTHDNYGDTLVLLSDRCTTFDAALDPLGTAIDLAAHIGYDSGGIVAENPPGYRYVRSARPDGGQLNMPASGPPEAFIRSCQIYVPDYEVESVRVEGYGDDEVVVVKLAGRLRHTQAAPTTIPRDRSQWPRDASGQLLDGDNQPPAYRTDENAVMEMLLYLHEGIPCKELVGDSSCHGNYMPGECWGACQTHFFFTRLLPRVYEEPEPNSRIDAWDSRIFADRADWAHFCIAAMCEGYIDTHSARTSACPPLKLPDYTYESLWRAVSASEIPQVIQHTETDGTLFWDYAPGWYAVQWRDTSLSPPRDMIWTTEAVVNAPPYNRQQIGSQYIYRVVRLVHARQWLELVNGVQGYGPMANMSLRAAVIDQLCAAINELHTARIEVPITLLAEQGYVTEDRVWDGADGYCSYYWPSKQAPLLIHSVGYISDTSPTALPSDWTPLELPSAGAVRKIAPLIDDDGHPVRDAEGRWMARVYESVTRFRVQDDTWLLALPDTIRGMVRDRPTVAIYGYYTWQWLDPVGDPQPCPPTGEPHCPLSVHSAAERACELVTPGDDGQSIYRAPPLRSGVLAACTEPGIRGGEASGPEAVLTGTVAQGELALTVPLVEP